AATAAADKRIASIVVDAIERVGIEGEITVEDTDSTETSLSITEGLQVKQGYLSPYFITDPDRGQCVLDDCYILIHERKISSMRDLLPLLEQVAHASKPLLIISQ